MNIINQLRRVCPDRRLSETEARIVAERQAGLLLKLTETDHPAVPSEIITELPRIVVQVVPGLSASGETIWTGGRWLVQLRAEDHPLRWRFSLAHELKHIIDHPYIDRLYQGDWVRSTAERREGACDYFAACLLMPRPWIKRAFTAGIQRPAELAQLFNTSRPAMLMRLTQLGLIEPVRRCRGPASVEYLRPHSMPATRNCRAGANRALAEGV